MSPEQIQGSELDHRTDQYAFGATCYHMFAGQPPFSGTNTVNVAVQHLNSAAAPLAQHRQDLPAPLCRVIHRMMEKDPRDRFSTPQDVQHALISLEGASVRYCPPGTWSLGDWLRASIPGTKQMVMALLICAAIAFAFGRRVFRAPRLVAQTHESTIQREETPERQFAAAILQPRLPAAWEAVFEHHPQSEEALWALLHLGLCHLEKSQPELEAAADAFTRLVTHADWSPDERAELRFLGLLGQARVAELRGRGDHAERDRIIQTEIVLQYDEMIRQNDFDAPAALEDLRRRILLEFVDTH